MTDQETTRIIAEKVMGEKQTMHDRRVCISEPISDTGHFARRHFAPLHNDTDLMMAWDKFCNRNDNVIHMLCNYDGYWHIWVEEKGQGKVLVNIGKDRRKAMCECMVKAVNDASAQARAETKIGKIKQSEGDKK